MKTANIILVFILGASLLQGCSNNKVSSKSIKDLSHLETLRSIEKKLTNNLAPKKNKYEKCESIVELGKIYSENKKFKLSETRNQLIEIFEDYSEDCSKVISLMNKEETNHRLSHLKTKIQFMSLYEQRSL